jgi:uncharacterized protein (TIGR02217 family)
MPFWLADQRNGQDSSWIQRFDPRFWTVNFPRPSMVSVVTTGPDALRVDAAFLREGDLAGLIWESRDSLDHPLLAYATDRDYSRTRLSFRWRSAGIIALDAANGPTLTVEGRDAAGDPRAWYVRLWNYAEGTPEDARIVLNFADLAGGFVHPAEADPVHPADIDRLFISMVAPGFVAGSAEPLAEPAEGWIEMSEIACTGQRPLLEIGDVLVPPHGLAAATAFDDCGTQTPARVLRNLRGLGYRGSVLHYVGMSHYMRLEADGDDYLVPGSGDPLCTPARAWHAAFFAECQARGYSPIASLSYELLALHCPADWQQRASNGDPARTGWDPPSALLSPANDAAMAWLQSVAAEFVALMKDAQAPLRFQVGEPWWWTMADGRPCLYDDAARAAFGGSPVEIADLRASLDAAQKALLDAAGALLSDSTAALVVAARGAAAPDSLEALLLTFLPTVLDPAMPEARRANLPLGWATPAFDRLQVEDYDWLTAGADARRRAGYALMNDRLGYPPQEQDYLAGFVLNGADRQALWPRIDRGVDEALTRNAHEVFVWAAPQICRDGYVRLPRTQEDDVQAFDDIAYPLPLGLDAGVAPEFSTSVAVTASGFERRNSLWSDARLRFDVGPGIRSEAELGELIGFFRARRGAARGFRLRDPYDFSSHGMSGAPTAIDQYLGAGDGLRTRFPLVKRYGDGEAQVRRITRPVEASIEVSVDGAPAAGWSLDDLGVITFAAAPPVDTAIRAGFLFDVPVRFAEDRLDISGAAFAAGEAPSVPVVELREAA